MGDTKKKCLGRFETSYMRAMAPPEPSDYPPRTRDYGQYMKVLNNIEMNKKFQFPMGLPKYKYDFCDEKYPLPGEKKKPSKPPLKYKPSCPQYAPYHSTMQDMSLIQRRLDTEPEQEHTWYRDKKPPRIIRPIDLFSKKPRTASPKCGQRSTCDDTDCDSHLEERIPESSFHRLERVRHELKLQDDPRTVLGAYYDRLQTAPEPKERPKMPYFAGAKKRPIPPPPPRPKPPQMDRIILDKSRTSREGTTYGFANSMTMRAGAMLSPPQKDPRDKPKEGVHSFFSRGSSDLTSENGTAMAECFYAHARPYGATLVTLAADKALNSRYF
ncbi:uncharacterized protein LOC9661835 isoform X2 [Selaginella moellendorffii]|uniref:uncharacterized protein LOC9661835 isoform X2 n=1 Tax=Selaginella moellendorffii TaxID=88036 RepID=UPI000D1C8ED8|nr:uncharacterized protein LOC9661835 isoform X2 [Selaginella moellendorffii]|eukprot:XP_024518350.1 uncharacterized protein LOC9661835 isoform X2 [Selaginella moellendorffii]